MKQSITVRLSPLDQPGIELLQILEGLLPVAFERAEWGANDDTGVVVFETTRRSSTNGGGVGKLKLSLPKGAINSTSASLTEAPVAFSDVPATPFPFRGRKLKVKLPSEVSLLSPAVGETVLASTPSGPIWVTSTDKGLHHIRSSLPLPSLAADGMLQQVLNADRFLELLPLLEFLHEACGDNQFARPPLRACFMFDDPNLHWPRYGFVDFRQIAAQAEKENYHVSFATIPLDAWFTHRPTVEIFRKNASRLSLAVHGNNHTKRELAQNYTPSARVSLLRQAIRRVERLECKARLQVSRVMVPPHGACSETMLKELPANGFEAACISHGSLQTHNKGKPWTRSLGYLPSEIIQGCPVLPRWGMTGNTYNTILLAAYLRQPIILRGHHADLRNGVELLDRLARFINGLGNVFWADMTSLSRINYLWQREGNRLWLTPLGRKLNLKLPDGATQLVIENPRQYGRQRWQISSTDGTVLKASAEESISLPGEFDCTILMEAACAPFVLSDNQSNRPATRAIIRRLFTEARDRLLLNS